MSEETWSAQDREIRLFVYHYFLEHGKPPQTADTAAQFGLSIMAAVAAYHRLHERHAFFLEPGTDSIRIANPLSAIPTDYRVLVNGRWLWANCGWDMLGIPAMFKTKNTVDTPTAQSSWDTLSIPAMLKTDAHIEAVCAASRQPLAYDIKDGLLRGGARGVVHFLVPAAEWYDDLIYT